MGYPLGPRLLAGAGALLVTAHFGILTPAGLLESGYRYAATALLVVAIPLVAFLTLLALAPRSLQALLAHGTRIDLRDAGHAGAAVIMAGTLFFVLGYGSIVNGIYAYEHEILLGRDSPSVSGEGLFGGLLVNAIVLILPVLLYVGQVGRAGARGSLAAIGLHREGLLRALVIGTAAAVGAVLLIALFSAAVQLYEVDVPENDLALEIARSVTVLGAFGIATAASLSEEVFFRGFLQPRLGLLGQAVLFALAHLSYVNVLQVVVTFALGLLFGILYQRTRSLWAPIAAHFTFNLLMLLAAIYAPGA